MQTENWKRVAGYEGLYEISDAGTVRSLPRTIAAGTTTGFRTTKTRLLKAPLGSHGYPAVTLCDAKGQAKTLVHRLVLETFVGPCPEGMEGCHNNGIKTDARLSNLRWGAPASNTADKLAHGTQAFGDDHWNTKLSYEDVIRMREAALFGARVTDLANAYGVSCSTVSPIINGLQRVSA